jgi:OPA family glycerol-3-phosphate transporter-like MFS transporter
LPDAHTRRWRRITLLTLVTGYAGYYVCRSNLSVVTPLLLAEEAGLTKQDIGLVASLGVLLYAAGKVSNGLLADFLGGRRLFLAGMVASAFCTVLFGLSAGLAAFFVFWALNRYVQSAGWGALMKIAARWFPASRHASVMGVLCLSYLLGDAAARFYLGFFIREGAGWRGVFFLSAGTLAALAVVGWFTLKESPREVGADEPPANPENVFGAAGESPRPEGLTRLLEPLLASPVFWLVCAMNVGLTLIRETFNFWTPTYLVEVAGLSEGVAAQASLLYPLTGAASAVLAGWLSDRLRGRHGRIALPALVFATGALVLLSALPVRGEPAMALLLVSAVSFFVMAPYTFCSGVMALDLGGKRGSSTAAGLIDSAGYLGAVLSGWGIGALAQRAGWPTAFGALAAVAGLTTLTAVLYWLLHESSFGRRTPAAPPAETAMTEPATALPDGGDIVSRVLRLFAERGHAAYLGEPVSQLEHALQAAWAAEQAHADSSLIAAALLHDVGHLLHHLPEDCAEAGIDDRHEELGARWVERHFGPAVSEPIRLHVPAKRYLCAAESGYLERLSPASVLSLKLQGGPFAADEAEAFRRGPYFEAALALRRWDEAAKMPGLATPPLEHFRPHLEAVLVRQPA